MSFRNTIAIRVRDWTSAVVIVLVVGGMALAQTEPGQSSSGTTQSSTPPAGAFGQEATTPQVAQFPPLSGLDEPSLEPNVSARSFFAPSFQVHQLADTNPGNAQKTGASSFSGDTHVMGNFALRRYWRRYQTSLDYTGGGVFYEGHSRVPNAQLHALNFDQAVLWRTGALHIRDAASYLPEGIFGGRFGGVGGMGGGLPGGTEGGLGGFGGGGGTSFFGTGQFGALGVAPRITNRAIIDVENSLSPRSAVTLAGGYALSHFTGANTGFIDSRQVSAQAGYDYMLSRRNSIAVTYGFQQFTFPQGGGGRFDSHSVHLMFGHQISGRMSLKLAAGPQIVRLNSPVVGSRTRVSGSGRASLRYAFPKTSLSLVYDRVENPGSGFFAGAISDAVHGSLARPLSRRWNLMADLGYSHHKREQISTIGLNARSYDYAYAGTRLSYLFSRTWSGFMTYQFNSFRSNGVCTTSTPCDALSDRHLFGVGISWHPQPIRID